MRRSTAALAAVIIAVGALAFWYVCLVLPAWRLPYAPSLGNVDLFAQIYPASFRAAAWMREGIFPLWNPYQLGGYPLFASGLYGLCYPPNLVYLLLPTAVAIEAVVVLHLALAGWFTFLFARALDLRPAACLAGAVVYMCGGFMTSQALWFTPAIAAATWLPLVLLAFEGLVRTRAPRSAALLAVGVAMPLLAGWVQYWLYTMYALAAYGGVRVAALAWSAPTRPAVPRIVALTMLGVVLGGAVTAVQILPTAELRALGPRRAGGLTMDQLVSLGSPTPELIATQAIDARAGKPLSSPYYVGPLVLALIASSVLFRSGGSPLVALWTIFVVSLLVCLARNTPFFEHVYLWLPAAGWFRMPQRIAFLAAWTAALLAAFGVDAVAKVDGPRRRVAALVLGLGTLALAATVLAARAPVPRGEIVVVGAAAVAFAAAVLIPGSPRRRAGFALLLVALVAAELVRGNGSTYRHPFHGTEILDRESALLDYVRDHQGLDRTYLDEAIVFDFAVTTKQGSLRGIHSITDYEPLSLVRFAELFDTMSPPRNASFPFAGGLTLAPTSPHLDLLQVLSLRFMVVAQKNKALLRVLQAPGSPWQRLPAVPMSAYALFERPSPLPRAYVATHAVVVPNRAAGLAALTDAALDPHQTVVLEAGEGLAPPAPGSSAGPAPVVPARITSYEPRRVVIEADAPAAGYLVLTDTYYPGWRASIDGAPVPIYAANHVVRAVPIAAGPHVVEFHYAPRSVRLGAWASGIALLAIVALAAVRTRGDDR